MHWQHIQLFLCLPAQNHSRHNWIITGYDTLCQYTGIATGQSLWKVC